MKIELKRLLKWSAPKVVPAATGMETVVTAPLNDEFRALWSTQREALQRAGVRVQRNVKTGQEYVVYGKVMQTAEAVGRSRASSGRDSKGKTLQYLAPEGKAYLPFQNSGIAYALNRRSTLFGDEMGLGKTVQAIGTINNLPAEASKQRLLFVAPASLLENWSYELSRWLMDIHDREVVILGKDNHLPEGKNWPIVAIASYRRTVLRQKELARLPWDVICFDEAHNLKTSPAKSQQTKAAKSIKAYRKLFLTGTPLLNRPIEMWPMLQIMGQTWCDWRQFVTRYCAGHQRTIHRKGQDEPQSFWVTDGQSHLDELQAELRIRCMIRRLKSEVLPELPDKRHSIIPLNLDSAARQDYERTEVELKRFEDLIWSVYTGEKDEEPSLGELSRLREQLGQLKAPAVACHAIEMLEELNKLVIFAHHHSVVEILSNELTKAGFDCVTYTGKVTLPERNRRKNRFQNDPSCRVFIGTLGAAAEGLTLTAASDVLFSELPWRMVDIAQAEDRCHRIGQLDSVNVRFYVQPGSIDEKLAGHVCRKKRIAEQALDLELPDSLLEQKSTIGTKRSKAATILPARVEQPALRAQSRSPAEAVSRPIRPPKAPSRPEQQPLLGRQPIQPAARPLNGSEDKQAELVLEGVRSLVSKNAVSRDLRVTAGCLAQLETLSDSQRKTARKICIEHRDQLPSDLRRQL